PRPIAVIPAQAGIQSPEGSGAASRARASYFAGTCPSEEPESLDSRLRGNDGAEGAGSGKRGAATGPASPLRVVRTLARRCRASLRTPSRGREGRGAERERAQRRVRVGFWFATASFTHPSL